MEQEPRAWDPCGQRRRDVEQRQPDGVVPRDRSRLDAAWSPTHRDAVRCVGNAIVGCQRWFGHCARTRRSLWSVPAGRRGSTPRKDGGRHDRFDLAGVQAWQRRCLPGPPGTRSAITSCTWLWPVVPSGDPLSPDSHGTNDVDYVAGSGASLRAAGHALRELLAAGELPHSIRWVFEAGLETGPVRVFRRGA